MKTAIVLAALLIAAPALAQTPVQAPAQPTTRPVSDLTRSLNSAPPGAVVPLTAPVARPTPPPPVAPTEAPVARVPTPAPRSATPAPVITTPAPMPTPPPEPVPEPPAMTVLNAAAISALPFTAELPAGFRITTGRPGPDFRIYTIRRGDQSFVTIYAGPASQFPIYTGQMAEVAGRASVVVDEDGRRRAVEHLFQRQTPPREIHVWVSSLEGEDQALAELIGQSIDVR